MARVEVDGALAGVRAGVRASSVRDMEVKKALMVPRTAVLASKRSEERR